MNANAQTSTPIISGHVMTGRLIPVALALTVLIAMPSTRLMAEEFCVTCYGPTATYRCAINQNGTLTAPPGAQLSCIKELAQQGGHKSCSIQRDGPAECLGKLLVINQDPATQIPPDHPINARAINPDTPETPETPSGTPQSDQTENAEGPGKDTSEQSDEPKTVAELAKRTAKSSKENLGKAGKAVADAAKSTGGHIKNAGKYVGSTAKKTWDCIVSLFSKCGS